MPPNETGSIGVFVAFTCLVFGLLLTVLPFVYANPLNPTCSTPSCPSYSLLIVFPGVFLLLVSAVVYGVTVAWD